MTELRVAVVGVGHLGRSHARVLAGLPGVRLVGVADTRAEQAGSVAAQFGCAAYTDYRHLIGQIDAVSVAVPTSLHQEVAGAFLDEGISAMVEKPLAPSVAEAESLVASARRAGAVLQVGHIERFNPALQALEKIRLRPRYLASERLGTYTFRSTDIGVVLDLMIHDLDLILHWMPAPVRSVSAMGVSVFGGHEDLANARIEFEDGCVADLTASRVSVQAVRKIRLWGAEGYATLDFAARRGTLIRPSDRLRQGHLDLDGLDLTQPAAIKEHVFGKILRVDHVECEPSDQLTLELSEFVRSVVEGTRPRVTGDDAVRVLRVAEQVLQSLNSHAWEGGADGPSGPHNLPEPLAAPITGLPAPKVWRYRAPQHEPTQPS